MRTIKILSVCTSDSGGGAARAAYRIHQGVRELGIDSRMFVKNKSTHDENVLALDSFAPKNLFYQAFDWTRNKCKNKIQHYRWNQYPQRDKVYMSDLRSEALHGVFQKLDYDVLHLHWINQRFIPLSRLPKDKPIIWTLHDSWPFCGVCHYFFECERYKKQCGCCPFLHSDKTDDLSHRVWSQKAEVYKDLNLHVVTPSHWLADCARQSSLFGRFPVMVIPNCLDVNVYHPLDEKEISPRWRNFQEKRLEKPLVLYGAMNAATDKRKGFANLLSALQILDQRGHGNDFELIVFGANESELGMNVNIPIHYVGYVSDTAELVSLYNLASVMVVPSLTENLSCAIMESLSCGTPVVAFNIGGNGDMIGHLQNGYLATERDDGDLAKGILWCLMQGRENVLSENARKKVVSTYTPEIVCKQYVDLYESLI